MLNAMHRRSLKDERETQIARRRGMNDENRAYGTCMSTFVRIEYDISNVLMSFGIGYQC